MPLYETSISLNLPQLDAIPIDVGDAYPYPRLEVRQSDGILEAPAIVLENAWLKLAFLPDLGGRLLLSPSDSVSFSVGGKRGVWLDGGIEFSLDGQERLNAVGPVEYRVFDEEDESAVLFGGGEAGTPFSWYVRFGLPSTVPALRVDVRVANRELESCAANPGFLIPSGATLAAEAGVLCGTFRRDSLADYRPRQSDSWSGWLVPRQMGGSARACDSAVLAFDGKLVQIYALCDLADHRVVLLSDGQTLEAPVGISVGENVQLDVGDRSVSSIALLGPNGPVLRWDASSYATSIRDAVRRDDSHYIRRRLAEADSRGAAHIALAHLAIGAHDSEAANEHLDDALTVNAEDPLAWWLKAALARRNGRDAEGELLNAHFLAPFDPMLRAEAFLAAPATNAPNPLVAPIAADPDQAVEVAVRLHEAALFDDLARWVEECLKHRNIPMLRYLLADALLTSSRMGPEAASHVAAVAQTPINPPYPWRPLEFDVLARLHQRFPDDARIAELSGARPT